MEEASPASGVEDSMACYTVFINTSLDTHLAIIVSDVDTVSELKKKIMYEHPSCFPDFGRIQIHSVKVKRKRNFYHLSDSMLVKSAFGGVKKSWFLYLDASSPMKHSENWNSCNPNSSKLLCITNTPNNGIILPFAPSKRFSILDNSSSQQVGSYQFLNQNVCDAELCGPGDSVREVPNDKEMEIKYFSDKHFQTLSSDSNKKSNPEIQDKYNVVFERNEMLGTHSEHKDDDSRNGNSEMQHIGPTERALAKKRHRIRKKNIVAVDDCSLKTVGAFIDSSSKDISQQEIRVPQNLSGNAVKEVPNDITMGIIHIRDEHCKSSSSGVSKMTDFEIPKIDEPHHGSEVPETLVGSENDKLKDRVVDVQCNNVLGETLQFGATTMKKRKIEERNDAYNPSKEKDGLQTGPATKKKRKINDTNDGDDFSREGDDLQTGPAIKKKPDNFSREGDDLQTGSKKRKIEGKHDEDNPSKEKDALICNSAKETSKPETIIIEGSLNDKQNMAEPAYDGLCPEPPEDIHFVRNSPSRGKRKKKRNMKATSSYRDVVPEVLSSVKDVMEENAKETAGFNHKGLDKESDAVFVLGRSLEGAKHSESGALNLKEKHIDPLEVGEGTKVPCSSLDVNNCQVESKCDDALASGETRKKSSKKHHARDAKGNPKEPIKFDKDIGFSGKDNIISDAHHKFKTDQVFKVGENIELSENNYPGVTLTEKCKSSSQDHSGMNNIDVVSSMFLDSNGFVEPENLPGKKKKSKKTINSFGGEQITSGNLPLVVKQPNNLDKDIRLSVHDTIVSDDHQKFGIDQANKVGDIELPENNDPGVIVTEKCKPSRQDETRMNNVVDAVSSMFLDGNLAGKKKKSKKAKSSVGGTQVASGSPPLVDKEPNKLDNDIRLSGLDHIVSDDHHKFGTDQVNNVGDRELSENNPGAIVTEKCKLSSQDETGVNNVDDVSLKFLNGNEFLEPGNLAGKKKKTKKDKNSVGGTQVTSGNPTLVVKEPHNLDEDVSLSEQDNIVSDACHKFETQQVYKVGEEGELFESNSPMATVTGKMKSKTKLKKAKSSVGETQVTSGNPSLLVKEPNNLDKDSRFSGQDNIFSNDNPKFGINQVNKIGEGRELSENEDPESVKCKTSSKDDTAKNNIVDVVTSEFLDGNGFLEPGNLGGKKKKSKKAKSLVRGTQVTMGMEHAKGSVDHISVTEPHSAFSGHSTDEAKKDESILSRTEKAKLSILKTASTSHLSADRQGDEVRGDEVESLQQITISKSHPDNLVVPAMLSSVKDVREESSKEILVGERNKVPSLSLDVSACHTGSKGEVASKKRKSKKANNSVGGTEVTSVVKNAKGSVSGISSTELQKICNNDHSTDEAKNEEIILSQTEKAKVSEVQPTGTRLLVVDNEADEVNGDEVEPLMQTQSSQTQENLVNMAVKSRRSTRKKQSSTAKNLSDAQVKEQNVGLRHLTSSTDNLGEVDASSKMIEKTKAHSWDQSKASTLEPEKETRTEESLHSKRTADSFQLQEENADVDRLMSGRGDEANNKDIGVSAVESEAINFKDYFVSEQCLHEILSTAEAIDDKLKETKKTKLEKAKKSSKKVGSGEILPHSDKRFSKVPESRVEAQSSDGVREEVRRSNVVKASRTRRELGSQASSSSLGSTADRAHKNESQNHVLARNVSPTNVGEVINSSNKEKGGLATTGNVFKDVSSESCEDGVDSSDASTRALSDDSFSSDCSEVGSETDMDSAATRSKNIRRALSEKDKKDKEDLSNILRSSSRYKKARLIATQSQEEDIDFVPDSQANQ